MIRFFKILKSIFWVFDSERAAKRRIKEALCSRTITFDALTEQEQAAVKKTWPDAGKGDGYRYQRDSACTGHIVARFTLHD